MLNKDFELHIIDKTKGFLSSLEIDEFLSAVDILRKEFNFSSSSFSNFERIIFAQFNLPSFIKDSLKYAHHLEITAQIAANSNYLTDVVVKSPGLLYGLFVIGYLQSDVEEDKLREEVLSALLKYKSFDSKVRYFRRLKNRITLKIAVSDFLELHDFRKIVAELSILAKVISSEFFNLCFAEVCKKHYLTENIKRDFVIAALGKLGGKELNYSSDIDLLFFFGKNEKVGENKIEYYELLHEAIRLFVEIATEQTADGFLYRVDIRLRPDGKYSPLAKTYSDYMRYYETRGEDWERQMLLKLNFIGGDREIFEKFKTLVTPFIFRKSVPAKYLKQVFNMKREIEKETKDKHDIKRCSGGIRDIEFAIQALQILYGGEIKEIRTGNTLNAVDRLEENRLLSKNEAEQLEDAYLFYRRIEHFLQLRNDTQTHALPTSKNELEKLFRFMNFTSEDDFLSALNNKQKEVRKIFLQILDNENLKENKDEFEKEIDFIDKKRADKNFLFLAKGENITGSKKFDERTIKLAADVLPLIKSRLTGASFPDLILENFRKIVETIAFPSLLYSEMRNEKTLNLLIKSILYSDRFVADILEHPNFIDDFLSRAAFNIRFDYKKTDLDKLRFYLNLQFSHGLITSEEFSSTYQKFYEDKIKNIFRRMNLREKLFIASLGSFGSGDLTFSSDLDLLLVVNKESEETEKEVAEFLKSVQKSLYPVNVDLRLRPEGESSRLVWGIKAYKKYLSKRASVWEFLSLSKLHFIEGNEILFQTFKSDVFAGLSRFATRDLKSESQKMYRKVLSGIGQDLSKNKIHLKKSHGYLKTIDFLSATLLAVNGNFYRELTGKKTEEKLRTLSEKGLIDSSIGNAFLFFHQLHLRLQSLFNINSGFFPSAEKEVERLSFTTGDKEIIKNLKRMKKIVIDDYKKFNEKEDRPNYLKLIKKPRDTGLWYVNFLFFGSLNYFIVVCNFDGVP